MADRCPICYTEEDPSESAGKNLRPCCKKFVCESCMRRWSQINNYCPLCKAQMRAPEEVLTESLSALLQNLSNARDCLQRIESVAEHITQDDTRSTDIRPIFTEVLDKGMKLGLLGGIPTMGPLTFGAQGEGIFGEAMSRDLISFMLAVGIRNTEPDFEIHFDVQEDRREDGRDHEEGPELAGGGSEGHSADCEDGGDDGDDEWEDVDD
jgi:RING finger family protein